jgi:hypothetical protein
MVAGCPVAIELNRSGSIAEPIRRIIHICFVLGTIHKRQFLAPWWWCLYGAIDMETVETFSTPGVQPRLSEKQAAEYVGISVSTLRRWRKRGVGPPYFKLGSVIRYTTTDLDAFIIENRQTPHLVQEVA